MPPGSKGREAGRQSAVAVKSNGRGRGGGMRGAVALGVWVSTSNVAFSVMCVRCFVAFRRNTGFFGGI